MAKPGSSLMAATNYSLTALTSTTRAFGTTSLPELGPSASGYTSARRDEKMRCRSLTEKSNGSWNRRKIAPCSFALCHGPGLTTQPLAGSSDWRKAIGKSGRAITSRLRSYSSLGQGMSRATTFTRCTWVSTSTSTVGVSRRSRPSSSDNLKTGYWGRPSTSGSWRPAKRMR